MKNTKERCHTDKKKTRSPGWEIERKFLIAYPDVGELERLPDCEKVEISQTYLTCDSGEERVRAWKTAERTVYYHTFKSAGAGIRREERESEISREEYEAALMRADDARDTLVKTRYRLKREGHCFEIDVYPFWNDRAILEVELGAENETFGIPREVTVIREVTGDVTYKNSTLSLKKRKL